jgi:hypothetical protein
VARLVLIDNAAALSSSQIDALSTYHDRNLQIDADLQRALTTAAAGADRPTLHTLLDDLALYRQRASQALAVEGELPAQPPGQLPPSAQGYYAQATNVLHFELLPAARQLREASQARLDRAYSDQHTTRTWASCSSRCLAVCWWSCSARSRRSSPDAYAGG